MEYEVRYYFSLSEEEKIKKYLEKQNLQYEDIYFEKTVQYDHPENHNSFYSKEIDGRFRLRLSKGKKKSSCMITWKRRIKKTDLKEINKEEEIEVNINPDEIKNIEYLLEKVIKMKKIESYERYRSVYRNAEVEIAVDRFPFGIALEIESKCSKDKSEEIIVKWLKILKLNIEDSYKLSWDDKYYELCKNQKIEPQKTVCFKKKMPEVKNALFINETN